MIKPRALHWVAWFSLGCLSQASWCQSIWAPMHLPGCQLYQRLIVGTEPDRCYYYGVRSSGPSCGLLHSEVYAWQNGGWDSITSVPGTMRSLVIFHDTLVMGGGFNAMGEPDDMIRGYVDDQLISFGAFNNGITGLRVIDDTLWAVGSFTQVDGQAASGVAKRVGGQWMPVGTMPGEVHVGNIIKYQGDLIITGACYSVNGRRGIYRLENGAWNLLGDALTGFASQAVAMIEYDGVLYIGGSISQAEGNVGHGIIRWDGMDYHSLGGGLLWSAGDLSTLTGVTTLDIRDGLLYCGGGFNYAGALESRGIAAWDGSRWCSVRGNFMATASDYVRGMAFMGDSLYVGCGPNVDGMVAGFAARAAVSDLLGNCDDTGVTGSAGDQTLVTLSPNPATDAVTITIANAIVIRYRVLDINGREVATSKVNAQRFTVERNGLAPGTYFLELTLNDGRLVRKVMLD
ncbi:MAG: T9SS type A sorting domain-containing protein [Flavobacteriales bacterium]|nr:T9SS type A sorting domain-containing protein [Flavobacteriales bacterium]